jgi:hypothetical protein
MIDRSTAEQKVIAFINEDYHHDDDVLDLVPYLTIEKPYGWIFFYNSRRYLKTQDDNDVILGPGPMLVERNTGRMIPFPSGCTAEESLRYYELGYYRSARYDLRITAVRNMNTTVQLLHELTMTFVIPEFAHGVEWKIPRSYSTGQIRSLLHDLPCTFTNQGFQFRFHALETLKAAHCCTYLLAPSL